MLRRLSVILVSILFVGITPAVAAPVYVFPVPECKVNYARAHHDYPATDILAKQGCKFVSPIDGVVDEVNRTDMWSGKTNLGIDRGGLYVSVIGTDGVRYYGSHLRTIVKSIQTGVPVKAGQILGTIGSTGSARGTAPHLHFGISWPTPTQPNVWWVRRGVVLPWKYLEAWNKGQDLSPAKAVAAQLAKVGEIPPLPKK
jgi:murein DD-endopeptidase MepM/ murein hydrolase activator NlpD